MGRIWRPMKTNARTFSRKTAVSQTAYDGSRSRAGVRAGAGRATVTAKQNIVRTLERPSRSAMIQTPNAEMNWMMMAVGTSRTPLVSHRTGRASATPATMLPTRTSSSVGARLPIESDFIATAPTASR